MDRTYLVTGATGNIGTELLGTLRRTDASVRALVRNADRELPDGVERAHGDLNEPSTLRPALAGVFAAFLMPGYRDMPGLLEECRCAGVGRVVLLSGSSAAAINPDNAISRYMLSSEAAVQESGLDWTILRPCAFMSNALQWLPQLRSSNVLRLEFADVAAAVIDPFDIAAVAAVALTDDGHAEGTYALSGPQSLVPAERVAILGHVLGRPLRVEPLDNATARAEMEATMPVEYVDAFFSFYVDGVIDESIVLPTVQDVTGSVPHTFEQWARAHASSFTV
jgi:uncharacterized protein YbjT (DUF2867 family)